MRKALLMGSAAMIGAVMQAPDAQTGAADGDTETVKRAVAKHELLDANGAVVENEEEATGIRYTLLANNQAFDFQSGMTAGERNTMLVIFGAKTLATNESSAMRNSTKGAATPDEQIDAVRERFALLETGKWVDRAREGVGAKVDLDALSEAICNVFVAEGKWTDDQVASEKKAAVRAKLDDDKTYARNARKHPPFAAEYARIKGAAQVSTDSFDV
jgi:glycerol-3-phosphate cytidylyltransferase-like family protein